VFIPIHAFLFLPILAAVKYDSLRFMRAPAPCTGR
jgi:predicted CDP-diglyceride synthetase/phosphatidate cytidylyltransferase